MSQCLNLKPHLTQVNMPAQLRQQAVEAALWVTASPCEWTWTAEQQELMARYCLWAAQRLACIKDLAVGRVLGHAGEGVTNAMGD